MSWNGLFPMNKHAMKGMAATLLMFVLLVSGCSFSHSNHLMKGSTLMTDLDGDGVDDHVHLTVTDHHVALTVNDQSVQVVGVTPATSDIHPLLAETPRCYVLDQKKGNDRFIVVSVVWKTVKIGSTAEIRMYRYTHHTLKLTSQLIQYKMTPYRLVKRTDGRLQLTLPELHITKSMVMDPKLYDHLDQEHDLTGEVEMSRPVFYFIHDYDGDGFPDIATERVLSTGALEWLPFRRVYTIYHIQSGQLRPVEWIPYSKEAKQRMEQGLNEKH